MSWVRDLLNSSNKQYFIGFIVLLLVVGGLSASAKAMGMGVWKGGKLQIKLNEDKVRMLAATILIYLAPLLTVAATDANVKSAAFGFVTLVAMYLLSKEAKNAA